MVDLHVPGDLSPPVPAAVPTEEVAALPTSRFRVVVLWDGGALGPHPWPEQAGLPGDRLSCLPPGSLAAAQRADPAGGLALVDLVCGWASDAPTLLVGWRGLPPQWVRQLTLVCRTRGRDHMRLLAAQPSPLAAFILGWRLARLAAAGPATLPEACALEPVMTAETASLALLHHPHRSRLVDLRPADAARSYRPGLKVLHWLPRPRVVAVSSSTPVLDGALVAAAPFPGPRLVLVLRSDDGPRPSLALVPGDVVGELQPGSLDADAWGQRRFAEVSSCPLSVTHLLPVTTGRRVCGSCERLVPAHEHPTCNRCTLTDG